MMRSNSVIVGATATLTASAENASDASTLSIVLTGRVLSILDVTVASRGSVPCEQIASADEYYRCPLGFYPIQLNSLAEELTLRVDAKSILGPMLVHLGLEFEIDDGDPAGPFVSSQRVGELSFDEQSSTVTRALRRRIFDR